MEEQAKIKKEVKTDKRPYKPRKPTLKRQLFINNLTNPNNPETFGNGTQSILASYPNVKSVETASSMANEILSIPEIKNEVSLKLNLFEPNTLKQEIANLYKDSDAKVSDKVKLLQTSAKYTLSEPVKETIIRKYSIDMRLSSEDLAEALKRNLLGNG